MLDDTATYALLEADSICKGQFAESLSTGYIELDNHTGGMHNGDLIILGGRSGMGKTALMLNILRYLTLYLNNTCVLFSPISPACNTVRSLLRQDAHINKIAFDIKPDQKKSLYNTAEKLEKANLYIDDTPCITLDHVIKRCHEVKNEKGRIDFIAIDYLQVLELKHKNCRRKNYKIAYKLKGLAMEIGCPILVLSQLKWNMDNRPDHYPWSSDLRGGRQLAELADEIWLLHREADSEECTEEGLADLIISKSRNGVTGRVKLAFLPEYDIFANLSAKGRIDRSFLQITEL